jgi:cobalt-zinc-cadmium efflux system outer membrane protein
MINKTLTIKIATLFLFASTFVHAQNLPSFENQGVQYQKISLADYLVELNEKNISIKSKKLASDTAVNTAKQAGTPILNPILTYARGSISTQAPYAGYTNPASNTVGATVTVEGWGKRSAREAYSQAEANKSMAEMIAETRSTETLAILSYIDALRTKLLWQSYQETINGLAKLNTSEASQKKAEFESLQKTAFNDLKYYSYGLMGLLSMPNESLPLPIGSLNIAPKKYDVKDLVSSALEKRGDVNVSNASIESATANLEMIKASRNPDLLPGVFYTQTPPYGNTGTFYGAQNSVSLLLSIPLGNGLLNNSDEIAAANNVAEQEGNLLATKAKVNMEINQTYLQYQSTVSRLENAENLYKHAKTHQNGDIQAILNLANAETELIDSRTAHAKTLILLERLSGNFETPNLQ